MTENETCGMQKKNTFGEFLQKPCAGLGWLCIQGVSLVRRGNEGPVRGEGASVCRRDRREGRGSQRPKVVVGGEHPLL